MLQEFLQQLKAAVLSIRKVDNYLGIIAIRAYEWEMRKWANSYKGLNEKGAGRDEWLVLFSMHGPTCKKSAKSPGVEIPMPISKIKRLTSRHASSNCAAAGAPQENWNTPAGLESMLRTHQTWPFCKTRKLQGKAIWDPTPGTWLHHHHRGRGDTAALATNAAPCMTCPQ